MEKPKEGFDDVLVVDPVLNGPVEVLVVEEERAGEGVISEVDTSAVGKRDAKRAVDFALSNHHELSSRVRYSRLDGFFSVATKM